MGTVVSGQGRERRNSNEGSLNSDDFGDPPVPSANPLAMFVGTARGGLVGVVRQRIGGRDQPDRGDRGQ
jgi:hypothetical protein